jgi:hypothetical protein
MPVSASAWSSSDPGRRRHLISGSGIAASIPAAVRERYGTAKAFNDARAAFEAAWRDYLSKRSETDFEEWRQDAAWHAAKYARWDDKGERRI